MQQNRMFALKFSSDRLNLPLTDFVKPLRAIPLRSGRGSFCFRKSGISLLENQYFDILENIDFHYGGFLLFPEQKIPSPV